MTEDCETLIVGGGPTGLGAAWRLNALGAKDWILCEAEDTAGGLASSVVDADGFTWDLGGHVQFGHYDDFENLMDDLLGVEGWHWHERESWVWIRERFVPYPFQLNLHRLPAEERHRCLAGLIGAAKRAASGPAPAPRTFDDWILATFGRGIADVFMRPYNFKVWAWPPESLAYGWIGDRVAVPDLARVVRNLLEGKDDVSWGPNNRFRFPRQGGTGRIWRTLADGLGASNPLRLRMNRRLVHLSASKRLARFSDGGAIRYQRLLTTIPLDALAPICDLKENLAPLASELLSSATHVLGIGLLGQPPDHLRGKCWMYFPESNCPFYRVTVFSHYAPANVPDPARTWSLMAEVSESPKKPVRPETVQDDTIQGLLNTGLIRDRRQVHHVWYRRLPHGYPTPCLDRDRALARLERVLVPRGIFSRGRFGAWRYEVSNQDHSFAQGVEVVNRWCFGSEEETLTHPEVVNARSGKSRRAASTADPGKPACPR